MSRPLDLNFAARRAVVLHPANSSLAAMHYSPERVQVQGVLVGQMRRYH